MESINKIEIAGAIGTSRINNVGGKQVLRATVATHYMYRSQAAETVIETTWHNLTYWGKAGQDLSVFTKGTKVHATGRLKQSHYTALDGSEKFAYEILAQTLEVIKE